MTATEYVAGLFDLTGHVGIITGEAADWTLDRSKF